MTDHGHDAVLQLYVEGTLSGAERHLVAAHLAGCARCRETVAGYKALFWDLEHPEPAAAPVPRELTAVSDRLMAAWADLQAQPDPAGGGGRQPVPTGAVDWVGPSLNWTRSVPGVATALGGLGRFGRRAGRAGLRGLWRLTGRGG